MWRVNSSTFSTQTHMENSIRQQKTNQRSASTHAFLKSRLSLHIRCFGGLVLHRHGIWSWLSRGNRLLLLSWWRLKNSSDQIALVNSLTISGHSYYLQKRFATSRSLFISKNGKLYVIWMSSLAMSTRLIGPSLLRSWEYLQVAKQSAPNLQVISLLDHLSNLATKSQPAEWACQRYLVMSIRVAQRAHRNNSHVRWYHFSRPGCRALAARIPKPGFFV